MIRCLTDIRDNLDLLIELPVFITYDSQCIRQWVLDESLIDGSSAYVSMILVARSLLKEINDARKECASRALMREPNDRLEANSIVFKWVHSHTGEVGNDRADLLAEEGSKGHTPQSPSSRSRRS